MKHLAIVVGLLCAAVLALPSHGAQDKDKEPSAKDLLSTGLSKAKKEDKRVFLMFGSPTCSWCKLFEKYHQDPKVAEVVGKYVVLVKVCTVKNPGGDELYKKYGTDRGVPAWTILDADAKVLGDSGDGRDNVGFPFEPKEITHYFQVFRKTCPNLSDTEVELLTAKLKEVAAKK